MKQFVINIAYRLRNDRTAPIQEMQLVAHSLQDAKAAFALWQLQTQGWNNSKPPLYKIVAAAKLNEVIASEERKAWMRLNPNRVKSQIYVCPHCRETCYCHSYGCYYRFCPNCGKRVFLEQNSQERRD